MDRTDCKDNKTWTIEFSIFYWDHLKENTTSLYSNLNPPTQNVKNVKNMRTFFLSSNKKSYVNAKIVKNIKFQYFLIIYDKINFTCLIKFAFLIVAT